MKILILSNEGIFLDCALWLQAEGNDVKFHLKNAKSDLGDGLIPKVSRYENDIGWADLVVMDGVEWGEIANKLRAHGKRVIGGTPETDLWELQRTYGMNLLKLYGVQIPETFTFTDPKKAMAFVKGRPARYVVKPSGNKESAESFVSKDAEEMIDHLEDMDSTDFILQDFIEGIEVGVGTHISFGTPLSPYQVNFEYKKQYAGNSGPNTGEMGTVLYYVSRDPLIEETLGKVMPFFADSPFACDFDVGCIVNDSGVYALEVTARWGFPAICIQSAMMSCRWTELLRGVSHGTQVTLPLTDPWGVGILTVSPGFPFPESFKVHGKEKDIHLNESLPIRGIAMAEVKASQDGLVTAGEEGYAAVVSGWGKSLEEAKDRAYERLHEIHFEGLGYRDDIGEDTEEKISRLQSWGYLEDYRPPSPPAIYSLATTPGYMTAETPHA